TFRGRAGLDFESTLFYLTGGLAVARVKDSFNCYAGSSGEGCPTNESPLPGQLIAGFSESKTQLGWVVGAGFEHMFDAHWSLRGEFRYVDLGRTSVACVAVTPISNYPNCAGGILE